MLAVDATQLPFEPLVEDAELGLEAVVEVLLDVDRQVVGFDAQVVLDVLLVPLGEALDALGALLVLVLDPEFAQLQTLLLVPQQLGAEEGVGDQQVLLQVRFDLRPLAPDDVFLPHLHDFDEAKDLDEAHLEQLVLVEFLLSERGVRPHALHVGIAGLPKDELVGEVEVVPEVVGLFVAEPHVVEVVFARAEELVVPLAVRLAELEELVDAALLGVCEGVVRVAVADLDFGADVLGVDGAAHFFGLGDAAVLGDARVVPLQFCLGQMGVFQFVHELPLARLLQHGVAAHELVGVLARHWAQHRVAALLHAFTHVVFGVLVALVVGTDVGEHDFVPRSDRSVG